MFMTRILTGITPSGTPHLGNYVGAIRPALRASQSKNVESFYFLADLHSLVKKFDPEKTHASTLEIAASWLACGLDAEKVHFYRQSDIPEITQLMWILSCIANKGALNRAHAYKAAVDVNRGNGQEDDAGIMMGLYMYPILMAADILLFNPHQIPVGSDQIQHVEIARDLAQRFNYIIKKEYFILPEALVDDNVSILPGLDGRKMSKSYSNTIPLFSSSHVLKKHIFSIVTDSRSPGEAKLTQGSALFDLYQAFASEAQTQEMVSAYADGISWADVKQKVFTCIEEEITPLREIYNQLLAKPEWIENQLQQGAQRVRKQHVLPRFEALRSLVGLKNLGSNAPTQVSIYRPSVKQKLPSFKQYRGKDKKFYFKFLSSEEELLLLSPGFNTPQEAGRIVALLKKEPQKVDLRPYLAMGKKTDDILQILMEFVGQ